MADRDGSLRVFYDTEFTDISPDARLISIGFVSEGDARGGSESLYIELADGWAPGECSMFVDTVVKPLLGRHNPLLLARAAAAAKIEEWLDSLRGGDREVQILCCSDSPVDWEFLKELYPWIPGERPWAASFNVAGRLVQNEVPDTADFIAELENYYEDRAHRTLIRGGERHHALIDAKALKHAWNKLGLPT